MSKKIKRLLIANRGEIVCRIVATCRALGIETVTLYAADDAQLPHARIGDRAVLLEGESLAETYLSIEKIIQAAKDSGADAIHPGYGFLSENAKFAQAVQKAGLVFVGPPVQAIKTMGDKAESRMLCQRIGVPTVPGYDPPPQGFGTASGDAHYLKAAEKIGYPLLVKAAAGGGGKGMRIVESKEQLAGAIDSARSEAKNAFGDDRLLLEKYIVQPHHIEVQVFSDTHGNHVHLFERECSIQRRYQKIVEESPSPTISKETRQAITAEAVKICQHIQYVGAGTVEFIMGADEKFYFLEMNTRLQVEHPVTEMVTGFDLVQWQIEVAEGGVLPVKQDEIAQHGHAIEVRLYAEDAVKDFMPAPGTLQQFSLPHLPRVRCENGYASGNTVSASYDPMIAKLAAWGETRAEAIRTLLGALAQTQIQGVANNRVFLQRVLRHSEFAKGKTATDFIPRHKQELLEFERNDDALAALAAAYMLFTPQAVATGGEQKAEHSAWTNAKLKGVA
ncbi:MAG: acetyl/propionyl/methylcrotonyl-CoA carboxylase subunit alpha [Alphaproteobacteria bacterium]